MNHIYKTVLNRKTGKLVVVSENASNQVKSEQQNDQKRILNHSISYPEKGSFLRTPLTLAISSLFSCMLMSVSYAETYTGSETLISSNSLVGGFNNFINDPAGVKKGIVVLNGNTPVESDSILTIDFKGNNVTIPDFAVAGYSSINVKSNYSIDNIKSMENNSLILKNGNINGNIYSGLVQTFNLCNVDCSVENKRNSRSNNLNNKLEVNGDFKVIGDLNSGVNEYVSKINSLTGTIVYSFSEGQLDLNANNNTVKINGDNNIGNINSGISKLSDITGDVDASVSALGFTTNTYFQAMTNENNIIINGENNFKDVNVGIIQFIQNTGNLTSPLTKVYQNGGYLSQTYIKNNNIDIKGKNNLDSDAHDVNLGAINTELTYGDLYSSNGGSSVGRDGSVITSFIGDNSIRVNGENNFKDIYLGNVAINTVFGNINSQTGENSLRDGYYLKNEILNNEISINGVNKIKSINSGNFYFKFKSPEFSSSKEYGILGFFVANDSDNFDAVNISDNKIILRGDSEVDGSIKTGTINFDVDLGSLNGKKDFPRIYINGVYPDRFEDNYINLNRTSAFAINNEVTIEGSHKFNNNGNSILSGGYLSHNQNQYDIATADGGVGDKAYILPEKYDVFTGNTLNYYNINQKTKDHVDFKEIANFQNYNFTIDSDFNSPTIPLLKAEKIVLGNDSSNMSDLSQKIASDIYVIEIEGEKTIANGTKYILMQAKDNDNLIANNNKGYFVESVVQQGLSRVYDVVTYIESNNVVALIEGDPEEGGPEEGGPEEGGPNEGGPNEGGPDEGGPDEGGPDEGGPDEGGPDEGGPEEGGPDEGGPEEGGPEEGGPEEGGPEEGGPEEGGPEEGGPEEGGPEEGGPEEGGPEEGGPEEGGPEEGGPEEGGPDYSGVETNPKLESLLLGNLSGLMLLTRNGDFLSENLFKAISEQNHQRGLTPFIIMSGNHTKYDTGRNSNIKSDGGLSTIGISWQDEQTTLGAFVENGWDRYTTFNGFTEVEDVSGRGHNRFNGVGFYGHYNFDNGWYADATLRGGRLHTSFETDDLYNLATDERAHYKLKTNYYGANLAGGYVMQFNEKNSVNLKAKYLWVMTESQDLMIASEQFHFNKLDSHRLQFHIENLNQLNSELTFISSLGYEHEITGKARGRALSYGLFEIDDQHVKGGTGISTLGLRYSPTEYKNLSMDFKATGYIGKREGGMGMLKIDYKF